MKYLREYNRYNDVTYNIKSRNFVGDIRCKHEYFTCRKEGKLIASCIIVYPTETDFHGKKMWNIDAGINFLFSKKENNRFVMLFDVKARKTGQGYGKILFDLLVEYLGGKGIERIYENVEVDNLGAQKFYNRLGFIKKGDDGFDIRYELKIKDYK